MTIFAFKRVNIQDEKVAKQEEMPTKMLWHFYGYDLGTRAHHWNASLSIISKFFKWNMDRTICMIHIIRAINIRTVDDDNRWCTQILIAHNVQVYTCTHSHIRYMLFDWGERNLILLYGHHQLKRIWNVMRKTNSSPNQISDEKCMFFFLSRKFSFQHGF